MTVEIDWDKVAAAEFVMAVLPDGRWLVLKGRAKLEELQKSGNAESYNTLFIEVADEDEADELYRQLEGSH